MTAITQEGFDWMPAGASAAKINELLEIAGWYLNNASIGWSLVTPGRFNSGNSLHVNVGAGYGNFIAIKPIGYQNSAGAFVSSGFMIGASNLNGIYFVGVYDAVNNIMLASVSAELNGIVKAWRGVPGATLLGASDPGSYDDQVWVDMETFIKVNSTSGEVLVRINGIAVLSLMNVDTQPGSNAYFDSVAFGTDAGSGSIDIQIDDFRAYDTNGSVNNTWLGVMKVPALLPNGNGGTTDFTRSNTGLANWQNISNQNVDDTLYLFDGTVSDFNLSTLGAEIPAAAAVAWVAVTSFLRQDDSTQITARNVIVSSSTTAYGALFNTSQSYSADTDILELDPHTGTQFTGAGANSLQVGPQVDAIA